MSCVMSVLVSILFTFAATAAGQPTHSFSKRASYPNGIATFNNYAAQSSTNCGSKSGMLCSPYSTIQFWFLYVHPLPILSCSGRPGTYGAAAGDVSPGISGGTCPGSIDPSNCDGQLPIVAAAPECPRGNCGKCYKVTNNGGIGATIGGMGNFVIVQIIDSCPAVSPSNYCKTDMPLNQRCGDASTNQLDIDQSAYMALTGQLFGSVRAMLCSDTNLLLTHYLQGPTLNILIEDSDCSGNTAAPSATPTSPAAELGALENAGASNQGNGIQKAAANIGSGANGAIVNEKDALHIAPSNQAEGSSSSTPSSAAQSSIPSQTPQPPVPSSAAQTSSASISVAASSTAPVTSASVSSSSVPNAGSGATNSSGTSDMDGECDDETG